MRKVFYSERHKDSLNPLRVFKSLLTFLKCATNESKHKHEGLIDIIGRHLLANRGHLEADSSIKVYDK